MVVAAIAASVFPIPDARTMNEVAFGGLAGTE
jgi:hypothetical protein